MSSSDSFSLPDYVPGSGTEELSAQFDQETPGPDADASAAEVRAQEQVFAAWKHAGDALRAVPHEAAASLVHSVLSEIHGPVKADVAAARSAGPSDFRLPVPLRRSARQKALAVLVSSAAMLVAAFMSLYGSGTPEPDGVSISDLGRQPDPSDTLNAMDWHLVVVSVEDDRAVLAGIQQAAAAGGIVLESLDERSDLPGADSGRTGVLFASREEADSVLTSMQIDHEALLAQFDPEFLDELSREEIIRQCVEAMGSGPVERGYLRETLVAMPADWESKEPPNESLSSADDLAAEPPEPPTALAQADDSGVAGEAEDTSLQRRNQRRDRFVARAAGTTPQPVLVVFRTEAGVPLPDNDCAG